MASAAEEVLDMNQAVERLGVHQRDPEGRDGEVPESPAEDPYEGLDAEQRTLLGVAGEPMVEIEIEGKKAKIEASKLPQAPQTPLLAVPQAPAAAAPSRLPEMDAVIARLQKDADTQVSMPTTQLMRDDPAAYNDQMALFNENRVKQDNAQRDLTTAHQARNEELNAQQNQVIFQQQTQLAAKWPEWGNQATRPLVAAKLKDYAMRVEGYSAQEAEQLSQGIADHRMVLTLRNGMRGEILAQRPNVGRKRDRKAPKVGAPGPVQTDTRKKSGERTDFLRKAATKGTSIREASEFLAGKFS